MPGAEVIPADVIHAQIASVEFDREPGHTYVTFRVRDFDNAEGWGQGDWQLVIPEQSDGAA